MKRLVELGFQEDDCIKALTATSGRLEASATWLLENATPIVPANTADNNAGWQFAGFEVGIYTSHECLSSEKINVRIVFADDMDSREWSTCFYCRNSI